MPSQSSTDLWQPDDGNDDYEEWDDRWIYIRCSNTCYILRNPAEDRTLVCVWDEYHGYWSYWYYVLRISDGTFELEELVW